MIDVEGFDDSVVYSQDLGRHRPKLIAFESKVMQSVRPEALLRCNGGVLYDEGLQGGGAGQGEPRARARRPRSRDACRAGGASRGAAGASCRAGGAPTKPVTPPAEPKKPYYPQPPDTKPEPTPRGEARHRGTAPG